MFFRDAKQSFFKESQDTLFELGFFKKYDCWYKIDMKNQIVVLMNLRRLSSGKIMEVGFSFATFMQDLEFHDLPNQKYTAPLLGIRHFEAMYADKIPNYTIIENKELFPSMRIQLQQMLQYVNKLVFPLIRKLNSKEDFYDFCLLIKQRTNVYIDPILYPLSTMFGDWKFALVYVNNAILNNEHIGNGLIANNASDIDTDIRKKLIADYEKKKEDLEQDKIRILKEDSSYFFIKWENASQKTMQNIKKAFTEDVKNII